MDQVVSQKAIKQWTTWVLVAVLLWVLDGVGMMGWVRFLGEPVVRMVSGWGGGMVAIGKKPFITLSFWHDGSKRIANLEYRLSEAVVDRQQLLKLEQENQFLRQNASITSSLGSQLQMVEVLVNGEELIVDRIEGLEVGDVVVASSAAPSKGGQAGQAGVLVGRVVRVGRFSSVVARPYDVQSRIAVMVQGKTTTGVVLGDGTRAILEEVLQTDSLAVGDVLVTSGVDDLFPAGLVVGQVTELVGKPADVTRGGNVELLGTVGEWVLLLR